MKENDKLKGIDPPIINPNPLRVCCDDYTCDERGEHYYCFTGLPEHHCPRRILDYEKQTNNKRT